MEQLEPQRIWEIAETVPPEWYEGNADVLEELVEQADRAAVAGAGLITDFRESSRQPFPNWDRTPRNRARDQFSAPIWGDSYPGRVM